MPKPGSPFYTSFRRMQGQPGDLREFAHSAAWRAGSGLRFAGHAEGSCQSKRTVCQTPEYADHRHGWEYWKPDNSGVTDPPQSGPASIDTWHVEDDSGNQETVENACRECWHDSGHYDKDGSRWSSHWQSSGSSVCESWQESGQRTDGWADPRRAGELWHCESSYDCKAWRSQQSCGSNDQMSWREAWHNTMGPTHQQDTRSKDGWGSWQPEKGLADILFTLTSMISECHAVFSSRAMDHV